MHHTINITPPYFEAVVDGRKTFEVRHNDRGYNAGDTVTMREYDPNMRRPSGLQSGCHTGREITRLIGYVTGFQQRENYVVFSLLSVE